MACKLKPTLYDDSNKTFKSLLNRIILSFT